MFCSRCGAQLDDNASFCPACGQACASSAQVPNKPNQRRALVIVCIVAACVIAASVATVVAMAVFGGGSDAAPSGPQGTDAQVVAEADDPSVAFFPEGMVLSDRGVGTYGIDEVNWLYSYKFETVDGRTRVTIGGEDGEGGIEAYLIGYATQEGENSDGPIWRLDSLENGDGDPADDVEVKLQVPAGLKDGSVEGVWRVQIDYPDGYDGRTYPNLVTFLNAGGTFTCAGDSSHDFAFVDNPMTLDEMLESGKFWGVYNDWVQWAQDGEGSVDIFSPKHDNSVSTRWVELDF